MASTQLHASLGRIKGERRLYTWAAAVAIAVVFFGFSRTYYLKGAFGTPELSTLKHIHGVLMTAWFVLFFTQVRLVATQRIAVHRQLGVLGVVWPRGWSSSARSSASLPRAAACRRFRACRRSSSSSCR